MTARAYLATLIAALLSTSILAAPKANTRRDAGATVLCYHIIEAPQDPRMEISRATFRQQMEYLELTGYNVVPLRHVQEYITGKRSALPPNAVVITLDDGWRSTYTEAYPELKRRNWPFTVFIYPKIIGNTSNALTWKQIREMADNGVDIQSHSLSHGFLSRRRHAQMDEASYAKWLETELTESRVELERKTGKKVTHIAYPYGDYDHVVVAATAKAGYLGGLTCEFGEVRRGSDTYRMKRVVIDGKMSFADFRGYMGTSPMLLAERKPAPGKSATPERAVVSARIARAEHVVPSSVGMAILGSGGAAFPFSYDAITGAISVPLQAVAQEMIGKSQRAIIWARDNKTGKRIEASWVFKIQPEPPPPPPFEPLQPEEPMPIAQPAASMLPPATPAVVPVHTAARLTTSPSTLPGER